MRRTFVFQKSTCPTVCSFVCLSVGLSVCLSVCLAVCLVVGLAVYLCVCLSVCPFVCLSVGRSVWPSVGLSGYLCVGLSDWLGALADGLGPKHWLVADLSVRSWNCGSRGHGAHNSRYLLVCLSVGPRACIGVRVAV